MENLRFIRVNEYGTRVPELTFNLVNQTRQRWNRLNFRFEITGTCGHKQEEWTVPVTTSIGWAKDAAVGKTYKDTVFSLMGKLDSCGTDSIKVTLLFAENENTRITESTSGVVSLKKQWEEEEAVRRAAEQAELARRVAERDAEAKKTRRIEEQREAERTRLRDNCLAIYNATADKKVNDLTVREEQAVRACQTLGMYPPR